MTVPSLSSRNPDGQGHKKISENLESPSLQCVQEILDAATECHEEWYDEAGWNATVHFPLLRLAIPRRSQVNVTPCTSARIQRDYLPASSQNGNMVDFCLSVDPKWPKGRMATTPALQTIDGISSRLPGSSINHTDFRALSQKPIAVSIETKCFGGSVKTAEVQLGVWQAAQWKMLNTLTKLKPERDPSEPLPPSPPRPDFLPAIHIVGHEWKFAAAIKRGDKTILLTECLLGSTNRQEEAALKAIKDAPVPKKAGRPRKNRILADAGEVQAEEQALRPSQPSIGGPLPSSLHKARATGLIPDNVQSEKHNQNVDLHSNGELIRFYDEEDVAAEHSMDMDKNKHNDDNDDNDDSRRSSLAKPKGMFAPRS
ncbi:hypothetical protein RB600_005224 [Gaeumannomyces tritici]